MILPSCYQLTVSHHHIIASVSKNANWLLFIHEKAFSLFLQRTQWSSSAFLRCHAPSRQSTTQRSLNIQIQLITKRRMGNSPFIFVHPVVDPSKKVWILENSLIFFMRIQLYQLIKVRSNLNVKPMQMSIDQFGDLQNPS